MKAMIQKFFRNEEGASAVEYGLLVALIAAVIVGVLGTVRNKPTRRSSLSQRRRQ